ncbi:MAG: hypothetical protein RID25_20820 [Cyclobacteriaceae bacterium]
MTKEKQNWDFIFYFFLSILLLLCGIYMLAAGKVIAGVDGLTQQFSATGGELIILMAIIFLVVSYNALSPFGPIRTFITSILNRKKRNK